MTGDGSNAPESEIYMEVLFVMRCGTNAGFF